MIKKITEETIAMLMQNGIDDKKQIETLRDVLLVTLSKYDIKEKETQLVVYDSTDANIIQRFFVAKTTSGLSARSLIYYKQILKKSLSAIGKHLKDITADDIRAYLTRARLKGSSNVTLNNERRVLSSFFTWCHDEEFLPRNIMKPVIAVLDDGKFLYFRYAGAAAEWCRGDRGDISRCCRLNERPLSPVRKKLNTDHRYKGVRWYYEDNDIIWASKIGAAECASTMRMTTTGWKG